MLQRAAEQQMTLRRENRRKEKKREEVGMREARKCGGVQNEAKLYTKQIVL